MKSSLAPVLLICSLAAVTASAQTSEPSAAPLPSAIANAHRVFLGNAGDQENDDCLRAYNVFYQGLTSIGRLQLVADPAEADLVLELHYEIDLGASIVSDHSRNSVRQFRVVLIKPSTHTVLWSLTERTNYAVFQKNRNKNLDETVLKLVDDVRSLVSAQPVAPHNNSKVRH
jgi:hypothetical protein